MKDLLEFWCLVAKRVVSRAFWIGDAIGLLLFVGSLNQPTIPWYASSAVFAALILAGCFSVWKDERKAAEAVQVELDEIKNSIPIFDIVVGEVKQFTVQPLIDACKDDVSAAQQEVDRQKALIARSGGTLVDALTKSVAGFELPGMSKRETAEEKLKRLNNYLKRLQHYEEELKQLYRIELTIMASRSDTNIEVWLGCGEIQEMIVEDDYAGNSLPQNYESSGYDYSGLVPAVARNFSVRNKLYISSVGDGEGAYSKIANLNAQRSLRVFDEDLYIKTDKSTVHIEARIASPKRNEPQVIPLKIPLTGVPVEPLHEEQYENE